MFIWTLFHIQWIIWWNIHLPKSNHYEKYILRCVSLRVIHTHAWRKIEKTLLISLGMVLHMAILCEILEISWLLWSLLRGLCICLWGRLKNFISHPNLSIGCGSSCLHFLFLLYFHFLSHICKKKYCQMFTFFSTD